VLADCDLERTVAGITHWALSNAGQACGAIEIAYVDERIADAFVTAMHSALGSTTCGTHALSPTLARSPTADSSIRSSLMWRTRREKRGRSSYVGGVPLGDGLRYTRQPCSTDVTSK